MFETLTPVLREASFKLLYSAITSVPRCAPISSWDSGSGSVPATTWCATSPCSMSCKFFITPRSFNNPKSSVVAAEKFNPNRYIWLFDGLKADGGKWDVIGMSLYPEPDTQDWRQLNNDCIANMKSLIERYNTPVMMCELGIYWNYEEAEEFFTDFMTKAKEIDQCLGVFTWEPQSYGGWKGYHKGLFDDTGKPTSAFNAFKR